MVSPIKQPLPPLSVELIADPDAGGFTARLPDIPAYGEGDTEEEALSDLRSALEGYIQTFGLDDAMSRIVSPQIRSVSWDLKAMSRA